MAGRPGKAGLDYFELDCHMDEKVELIEAEFGLKGFAIVIKLFQYIYSSFGYYCNWDPEISVLWAYRLGCSHGVERGNVDKVCDECALSGFPKNLINEVVAASIRRGIFSGELFDQYHILTSSGIQKRYINAVSRREKVDLIKEYLLIDVSNNSINVCINSINVDRNSINVCGNSQSKEKEIKEKESKENKSREKETKEKEIIKTDSIESVCQTDVRRIVAKWNELASFGVRPISKMAQSAKRYDNLTARIREYGVDDILTAIDRIKESGFLCGKNNRGWTITFDWFVLPSNFPKVLEGNYDNGSHEKRTVFDEWRDA